MNEIYVEWIEFNGNWTKSTKQDSMDKAIQLFNSFSLSGVRILFNGKAVNEK
jgi:hypothetical protein